jgi:hypothetical protein
MSPLPSLFAVALLAAAAWSAVSPDGSCGQTGPGGSESAYTCPSSNQCCSSYGYCGKTTDYCLTTVGCQPDYSNSTAACTVPVPGETVSPDGTCGTTGFGQYGYVCPQTGYTCCSVA